MTEVVVTIGILLIVLPPFLNATLHLRRCLAAPFPSTIRQLETHYWLMLLRRDIQSAANLQLPIPGELRLTGEDGKAVTYKHVRPTLKRAKGSTIISQTLSIDTLSWSRPAPNQLELRITTANIPQQYTFYLPSPPP